MNTLLLSLSILNALTIISVIALCVVLLRTRSALQNQSLHIDRIQNDLNAMCSGALGMGQHLSELENTTKKLRQRQDQLDLKEPTQTSYKYALKMAREGADLQSVAHDCGIAEGEAELVMLASRMGG